MFACCNDSFKFSGQSGPSITASFTFYSINHDSRLNSDTPFVTSEGILEIFDPHTSPFTYPEGKSTSLLQQLPFSA